MDDAMKELQRAADGDGLEMEFLELCKDAERYRWLRDEAHDWEDAKIVLLYAGPDFERASGGELDGIIDAEMMPRRFVLGSA